MFPTEIHMNCVVNFSCEEILYSVLCPSEHLSPV
uniref:Uncharacterized protein n=1 Tax=Arundo donax TaxID=35708 RepID=A0A0A9G6J8_ARUDO